MALIAKADLEARATAAEIARFAGGTGAGPDAKITDRIAEAESRMRSEAIKWCTPASWDAMTSATLPKVAKIHLVSDAVFLLAAGNEHREEIDQLADEARLFRIRLAKGQEKESFAGVLVLAGAGASSRHKRGDAPTFGRSSDGTGAFDLHDPKLP